MEPLSFALVTVQSEFNRKKKKKSMHISLFFDELMELYLCISAITITLTYKVTALDLNVVKYELMLSNISYFLNQINKNGIIFVSVFY